MKNTELYILLNSFSSKDFEDFELFLFSPLHNRNKSLNLVYNTIKSRKDLLVQKNHDKILHLISKRTSYSTSTVKKLISFLSDSVLEYYKIKSVLSDEFYLRISLNQYLLKNGDSQTLKKSQKILEQKYCMNSKLNIGDYYRIFLHKLNLFNSSVINLKYQNKTDVEERLNTINEAGIYLSLYSLIQLTLLFANYVLNSVDSGTEKVEGFRLPLRQLFETSVLCMTNAADKKIKNEFNLYYSAYKCYETLANANLYKEYKDIFLEQADRLDHESFYINYNLLLGYCSTSQRVMSSDQFFDKEELELLNYSMEKKLYKNEITSNLSPITYRNYVLLCLENMDMVKLKNLIENYSSELDFTERVDMVNYAFTHYYYGMSNYKNALKYLNTVDLKKFVYKYDLLDLEIKIYYERNDFTSLERLYHNYREIIKKDTLLTKYDKTRFLIFFKHFSDFLRIINKPDNYEVHFSLEYLQSQICKEKSFVMKKWLTRIITSRLELLKKKNS